ncbi:putative aaa family atpase protein [Botrytis fragariae]|uniref:Putative aaa family atpase protein n=1 Tax=Botrytis fragariae TaxID=1964551 RepID=A0A8H6B3S2_9HELO|nr:putative aaa family atpase protein [Botrytis fragariae]KAF5878921.1 putative aaa family atpase protein [Botrytis fragariae]
MDSEIAQASRPSSLSKLVKLSRGSKKKGLTNISGLYGLGGRTNPENDKPETDEESKKDEDDDEEDNEGEGTRRDKNEERSRSAGRANKYRNPGFGRDFSDPSYPHAAASFETLKPEQSEPELESVKPSAPPQNVGKTRITISDNLSTDDNRKNRRLLALKPKSPKPASPSNLDTSGEALHPYYTSSSDSNEIGPEVPGGFQGKHLIEDYQLQLMLLEQQNKKRLMMARQEQEGEVFGASENRGPIEYGFNILQANGYNSLNPSDQMKRGPTYMNHFGIPSSPLPEGPSAGSYRGDTNFNLRGGSSDPTVDSPYLTNMNSPNMDIFKMRAPSPHPGAAANQMVSQQMALIQQQVAMARQQQMAQQNLQQMALNPQIDSVYTMNVRSWSFDDAFNRVSTWFTLEIKGSEKTEYAIRDLNIRPIAYASDEDRKILQSRGEMFWKCRERHFVSYQEHGRDNLHGASEERYMIDMKTFRELHPEDEREKKALHPEDGKNKASDTLDEDAMAQDSPPYPSFVYLPPSKIIGYNVVWDKKAFKKLVLAQKTKDLIEALIVNQIAAEKSTDLISGKGNGLIILLHGGPGTGKTLTTEGVAEIAEKPLYKITYRDIKSKPEEVEQFLNSVLHLGKAWSCFVLLDEADVFLEERSMSDIKRNALVSTFLRVLEYHDGIIILPSNRVGAFDEAFKSRIQLALHYPSLTRDKRYEIWAMFITRLRELGETQVDFSNLEDHRWDLADYKLNGRQIRNAIQISRQYVSWKNAKEKMTLNFEILKEIIEISGEFDTYINKLNNGMSPY